MVQKRCACGVGSRATAWQAQESTGTSAGALPGGRTADDRAANRLEHFPAGVRLVEVPRAAGGARLPASIGMVMGRDEEDRRRDPPDVQLLLQLEPGHPGQKNIEHQ